MPDSKSKRVCADANAVIDYIRECALHDLHMLPTGRRANVLRERLDEIDHVFVTKTAENEARHNLAKDIRRKLNGAKSGRVLARAVYLLEKYCDEKTVKDQLDHVSAAREMYAKISSDPTNQKFSVWKRKKGAFVDNPILGSTNDLRILSTAAHIARQSTVEMWTHDMDFTMFGDEIWNTFSVKVVDTYRL